MRVGEDGERGRVSFRREESFERKENIERKKIHREGGFGIRENQRSLLLHFSLFSLFSATA